MALTEDRLCRETVRAALAFHARAPWQDLPHDAVFTLELPGEASPLAASILGSAGTTLGLALTRGRSALRDLKTLLAPGALDDDLHESVSHLILTLCEFGVVPEHRRVFLTRAGFKGDEAAIAPLFLAKPPDHNPREIESDEARLFLLALNGILAALDLGYLHLTTVVPGMPVPNLIVSGDPLDPEVEAEFLRADDTFGLDPTPLAAAPEELAALPRLSGRWLAGLPVLPAVIDNDERTLRALLVADETSGALLALHLVMGGDLGSAHDALCRAFLGENAARTKGLPEEILVSSSALFDSVAPTLAVHDVRCRHEPEIPVLQKILEKLREDLFRHRKR